MKLLSIDTSTDYLSVAVTDGAKVIARIHKKAPRSHSSLLMPTIAGALLRARTGLKKIDGFCIGVGPGSFTGLRIGVATVKGLAIVTGKPIVAVPTFDAIAMNAKRLPGVICPVLDARKAKVYASLYRSDGKGSVRRISRYILLGASELLKRCEGYDNLYFLGDYADKMAGLLTHARDFGPRWHPRSEEIASIGLDLYNRGKFVSAQKLEPMYLYSRECDITGK